MQESNDAHYTRSVVELSEILPVITSQAVFSKSGIKLVNEGVRLNNLFFERLAQHKIAPPLEQCLVVENGVNSDEIVAMALQLLKEDPHLARMAKTLPESSVMLRALKAVPYSDPVTFMLTLAREQRPLLLTHSITVALIGLYLGIRVGMSQQQLTELAAAGLLHDLGELRLEQHLFDPASRLSTDERQQICTHPLISHGILQSSPEYSAEITSAVLQHHERMDGSGYPFNLLAEGISKAAQILMLAEVAASKIGKSVRAGGVRLEMILKLNSHQFSTFLLGYMSVLYQHESENPAVHAGVQQIHDQVDKIGLVFRTWEDLLGKTAITPRSAAAFIRQRLAALLLASLDAGINPADKQSLTAGIEHDGWSIVELSQLSQETLWQIKGILFEVNRRWPDYPADVSPQGKVVNSWMSQVYELLLDE